MAEDPSLDRRTFTKLAASLALAPALRAHFPAVAALKGPADWEGYRKAIVIDALASPGPFNVPDALDAPLSAEMLANARSSGITAVNLTLTGSGDDPFERAFNAMAYWERELDAHPDVLMKIKTVADIRAAKADGRLGLIYGFQDATMLGEDVNRVDLFQRFGLRIIQLTYNRRNLLGDGCLEEANAGLSTFGRAVVDRMNATGVVVDLGHCGQRTTADAIAVSRKPVAISHSGCSAVAPNPRSKRDEELRAMADKGGVIGIYMMPFLRTKGQPMAEDLVRHIEHAIQVCGEDHVGIGSDLSISPHVVTPEYAKRHREFVEQRRRAGISAPGEDAEVFLFIPDLNSPRRIEMIAERLLARKHGTSRVEKLVGGNFARLFAEVWVA
jgi:membrane dipeptidase